MSHDLTPAPKRRKIRKGTTSCWECKRRKVRCNLVDDPGPVCAACRRRGTKCLTQDMPHEAEQERVQPVGERIEHVEALVDRLVQGTPTLSPAPVPNTQTHTHPSVIGDKPWREVFIRDQATRSDGRLETVADGPHRQSASHCVPAPPSVSSPQDQHPYVDLSRELHASLPSWEDISRLYEAGTHVSIAFDVAMMVPYSEWESNWSDGTASLLEIPSADSHPVLLAKYMFLLVRALQHLDFKKSSRQIAALSDSPQGMSKRVAETAIRLVTTRDELLDTVESLECVVMEACYHLNRGNSRSAWTSIRRAMALAQVMGLHRPGVIVRSINPQYKVDTSFLWYRIVYLDRFMCLFMGLPQGSMDRVVASGPAIALDSPLGRLERLHCSIASHILERNDVDPASDKIGTLRKIDSEINRAAEMMPSGWWMTPDLAKTNGPAGQMSRPPAVVWDMLRLVAQIYHFGLINQLHIPFMLGFTSAAQLHTYSQATCANASREILSRYIAFRDFNRVAFSCRMADFFTLIAALLLLVGHIRQHSLSSDFNFLAHQRQGDRAIVQKTISYVQELSWVNEDKVTAMGADILSRLLDIEAEAAKGRIYSTQSIQGEEAEREAEMNPAAGASVLRFCVPYFGKIRIVYKGVRSEAAATRGETGGLDFQPAHDPFIMTSASTATDQPIIGNCPAPCVSPVQPWYAGLPTSTGIQDYTFPGLDLAFFDGLIREPTILGDANTSFQ
ncbi:hypothetical protein BJX63DRAFT_399555 [Aspergillus granulosus]|uniref:Zn(2)-C6 fungal-type domain-containing protein n=1 Tax=Aspergillus granulosus TaxID=176169 RepID=A0ABR4H723_9EURO